MSTHFLPERVDNTFRGQKLAVWLFAAVTAVKTLQIVAVFMDGPQIISTADGIPLRLYPAAAAATVVALFQASAISRAAISLVCVVVMLRYRSVMAAIFALLAVHDVVRELLLHPVRTGTPVGPLVNAGVMAITLVGVVLAMWERKQ